MSDNDNWFKFEITEAENETEALLKVESPSGQRQLVGKEALKLWKKIRDIADEFPEGPKIYFGMTGR